MDFLIFISVSDIIYQLDSTEHSATELKTDQNNCKMEFDKIISSSIQKPEYYRLSFNDILFSRLDHRPDDCIIIKSHIGEQLISINLNQLRKLAYRLSAKLTEKGIRNGDTVMLASFSCSNELTNMLIFTAAVSMGVRIFIPIYPEPAEFNNWKAVTGFSHVIISYSEILGLIDHTREKEIVQEIRSLCGENGTGFFDSNTDFQTFDLIRNVLNGEEDHSDTNSAINSISPDNEMVIFTTSGTSGKSRSATGVSLMNGFGTTETLMISLNRSGSSVNPKNFGTPLPGVTLGLKRFGGDLFELAIHSIFQSVRTIGEPVSPEFFETGDLVSYDEASGQTIFHGRKSTDFLKDEYGVKIPLNSLKEYYRKIYEIADWIEWIPMINIPGLAAIIFISSSPTDQKKMAALIKSTNVDLKLNIEPFEYSHRHLERFIITSEEVPRTRKGTVSKDQICKRFDQTIAELRNPFVFSSSIESTDSDEKGDLHKFSNPYMAELLEALRIDRNYVRGDGDFLYYKDGTDMKAVTDFVGGFGASLLGHNHPKVKGAVVKFLDSGFPALNNQGSRYYYPALLARELNRLFSESTGKYFKVLFASSGTEATEMAIHHAWYEWRSRIEKLRDEQFQLYGSVPGLALGEIWDRNMRKVDQSIPCLLVVNNCFHGYTSGARSMLNNSRQRDLFSGLLRPSPLHVTDSGPGWREQVLQYIGDTTLELQIFHFENGEHPGSCKCTCGRRSRMHKSWSTYFNYHRERVIPC